MWWDSCASLSFWRGNIFTLSNEKFRCDPLLNCESYPMSLIVDDMENKRSMHILFMATEKGWEGLFVSLPLWRDVPAERTHFIAKLRPSAPAKCFRFLSSKEAQNRAPSTGNRILSKQFEVLQRDTSLREFCGEPSNFLPLSMIPSRTSIKSVHSFPSKIVRPNDSFVELSHQEGEFPRDIDHYQKEFYTPINKHKSTDAWGTKRERGGGEGGKGVILVCLRR